MNSPARRHLARIASGITPIKDESAGAKSFAPDQTGPKELSDYQAAMAIDLGKIKAEVTLEGKARVKSVVLPTYLDFVNDYFEKGRDYPNDIAVQVMIWLLDIGNIEKGLNLALYLVKQGQKMPARFNRPMTEFLCDFFYDWSGVQLKADQSASPYLDLLTATAENDKWDMHPLFMSKLFSILAKHKKRLGEYRVALDLCGKAEAINPEGAGVKGLTKELQKLLESNSLTDQDDNDKNKTDVSDTP